MPRTKSARKAQRQTRTRTARNRAQRSRLRNAVKNIRAAGTPEERQRAFAEAERLLDRDGRKGLIHRNAADRLKSRLAKLVK